MDYLSTIPQGFHKVSLPKCGKNRNMLECYCLTDDQLSTEETCIRTLNASEGYINQQKNKPGNDLLKSKQEALQKLLSNHPFPIHQGPFEKHISGLQYEYRGDGQDGEPYTFYSYTTFKHESNLPCKLWSINSEHIPGEPKHVLAFTTEDKQNGMKLWGPASDLNMSIMYNCNKHECVIMCPCTVCEVDPSKSQCITHHVDLPRKFNIKVDSFTVPCSSEKLLPLYNDRIKSDEFHTGHKYAGIPRSCLRCRLDLLDHQIHHHVLHSRCKFCAVVLRLFESNEPIENLRQIECDIKRTDDSTCSYCYKIFTSHSNRTLHERTEHGYIKMTDLKRPGALFYNSEMYNQSLKLLECKICKCSCDDSIRLQKHQMDQHGVKSDEIRKPYECRECSKSYASKIALKLHDMRCHQTETRKYSCEACKKTFHSDSNLQRHQTLHHDSGPMLQCDKCDEQFSRQDNLTRHVKEIHRVANVNHYYSDNVSASSPIHAVRPYQCQECSKKFKRKEYVTIHERNCHPMCQKCDKRFDSRKSLNEHTRETHQNKFFSCEQCDKSFQKQSNLKRHKQTVHANIDDLKCTSCQKIFNRRDSMIRHMTNCKK